MNSLTQMFSPLRWSQWNLSTKPDYIPFHLINLRKWLTFAESPTDITDILENTFIYGSNSVLLTRLQIEEIILNVPINTVAFNNTNMCTFWVSRSLL